MTSPATADAAAAAAASRWTVAIFALLGLGAALVFFAVRAPTYESIALVAVSNPAGPIGDEIGVVTGDTVIDAATSVLGFAPDISVTSADAANLLTITAKAGDASEAAEVANTVAQTYVQAQTGAAANIAQQATPATEPSGLPALAFAAIGTLIGAIVGAIVSYFQLARLSRHRAEAAATEIDLTDALAPERSDARVSETVGAQSSPAVQAAARAMQVDDTDTGGDSTLVTADASDSPQPSPTAKAAAAASPPGANTANDPNHTDTTAPDPMTSRSFSDAASGDDSVPASAPLTAAASGLEGGWLDPTGEAARDELTELDRRTVQAQFEAARYELELSHEEQVAHLRAEHEREVANLRAEIGSLNKQARMHAARLKNRSGTDQTRVGDLEAQVDALEVELAGIRETLERERITHAQRLTEERGTADRALDNARRQYREELAKHVHNHRQSAADHRSALDNELAEDRAKHAAALEQQHLEYERQLESDRERAEAKMAASAERHAKELSDLKQSTRQALDRQASQHKDTIAELRSAGQSSDVQLRDLEKENRMLRVEITSLQKQARHNDAESASTVQRLSDELAIIRGELDGERERNAALRADVLRRSAEAHQAIDRAVEERTAQLSELEASVARQRQYADTRVREISAAAEEQSRQAATREANLTATVSRLKREIEELKRP